MSRRIPDDGSLTSVACGVVGAAWLVAILVTHGTHDVLRARGVEWGSAADLHLAKAILYLISTCALAGFLLRPAWSLMRSLAAKPWKCWLLESGCLHVILLCLVYAPGIDSMGKAYAEMSNAPFAEPIGWYNKRLLLPSMAYFTGLGGAAGYTLLSQFVQFAWVAMFVGWMRFHVGATRLLTLSLGTSSFVIYPYFYGGYPDPLVAILLLAAIHPSWRALERIVLLAFSIMAHEASLFPAAILALWMLPRRGLYLLGIMAVAYVGMYKLSVAGGGMLHLHEVNGRSTWEWLMEKPWRAIFGLFMGYKLAWVLWLLLVPVLFRARLYRDLMLLVGSFLVGLALCLVAVDTSRMVGFSMVGLLALLSLAAVRPLVQSRVVGLLAVANLLVPSAYVGLNTGIILRAGLYVKIFARILS